MPRTFRSRRPRRRFTRRRPSRASFKKKVTAIVTRQLHRAEPVHYIDEYSTGTAIGTTTTFINLSDAISQGDGITDRTGDRINVRRIQFRFSVFRNASAVLHQWAGRIMLIKWFADSTEDPLSLLGDILVDGSNDILDSPITTVPTKKRKFAVVMDRRVTLDTVGVGPSIKMFSLDYRPKGRMGIIDYMNGSDTQAKGMYYLVAWANQSNTAGNEDASLRYHCTQTFDP